jgi:hypothetical protein
MLNAGLIRQLESFQAKKLKQLQGLPDRTSNIATIALVGCLPVEAEIDKRAITLYRNAIADRNSIEHHIARRQLSVKDDSSKSWFIHIGQLLDKYNLPSAISLLSETPSKVTWRSLVRKAAITYWNNIALIETSNKTSLRYMSTTTCHMDKPAGVWSHSLLSHTDTVRAFVKVKLLTGCYKLQAHEALFARNQHAQSAICKLCSSGVEDRLHFVVL